MTKVKTTHEHHKGIDIHLPHVGLVSIDKDGNFEAEDHLAVKLLESLPGFEKEKSEEDIFAEKRQDFIAMIMSKKVAELKELCASFPAEEWEGLSKADLQTYLIANL